MGVPVWKVVLLGWMVYGAGFGWGSIPPCLGIISTHAEAGAPFGKQRAEVKTCSMTAPKNTASIIPETSFLPAHLRSQHSTQNKWIHTQILRWTFDFSKALLLSHNCIKMDVSWNTPCCPSLALNIHMGSGETLFKTKKKTPRFLESVIDLDKETKTSSVGKEISMENCNSPCQTHALSHCYKGWLVMGGSKNWVYDKQPFFFIFK